MPDGNRGWTSEELQAAEFPMSPEKWLAWAHVMRRAEIAPPLAVMRWWNDYWDRLAAEAKAREARKR